MAAPTQAALKRELGALLRECRERMTPKMTQPNLAEQIERTSDYWRMIEHGKRRPSAAVLHVAARVLNMDASERQRAFLLLAVSWIPDAGLRAEIAALAATARLRMPLKRRT